MGVANTVRLAGQRLRTGVKRSVQRSPLDAFERYNAEQVWTMQLGSRQNVESLVELLQLIERLQIPMQPMLRQVVESAHAERPRGQFSFSDFTLLLEQCKTLHQRWLHKVRGKCFDDEILEAYIAVGGEADSSGTVDVALMQKIVQDFHLTLPQLGKPVASVAATTAAAAEDAAKREAAFSASLRGRAEDPSEATRLSAPPAERSTLEFTAFVNMLRDGDGAYFSNQDYLGEHDLDDGGGDDDGSHAFPTAGGLYGSRRASHSQHRRGSFRGLPPLGGAPASGTDHHQQPARSHTSMDTAQRNDLATTNTATDAGATGGESPTAAAKSRRRYAASPPPKSRFPILGRAKREKKPKFANW